MSTVLARLTAALSDRYRFDRELGAGGMATVYLAHDIKHERDVAIKVLHPDLGAALGGERFLSEIRTTARLQHPHILPLLDSGEADGLLYYVMPLVTGETLRARLEREKQLPIDVAVLIAREVADALGYAHSLGVIHRDIKPENILLQGGHALVADFGIALAVQSAGGARMTQTGLSLGTPQYMSPEQAMGERAIDARSDIYALGAITYEMLTGDPPFTGSTVQSIVAKVLTEKPTAPSAVRDTVTPAVEAAVLKALAKLPADRWATTTLFADALTRTDFAERTTRASNTGGSSAREAAAREHTVATGRGRRVVLAVLGATALSAAAAWLGWRAHTPEPAWSAFTQLTDASGVETSPSIAPDGESFLFVSRVRGTADIYSQRVGGRNPTLVVGDSTVDELWPAHSPDGKQIAYNVGGGGIFVVGATGESPRRVTSAGMHAAWSPDGTQLVYATGEGGSAYYTQGGSTLEIVGVDGGSPRPLTVGLPNATSRLQPSWSPSGKRIVFWATVNGVRDIYTVEAAGGDAVALTQDAPVDYAPSWSPDGKFVYFASDRGGAMGLWRIAVNEASGARRGSPEMVATGTDLSMDLPRLSADGRTVIFRSVVQSVNPAALSFDPVTRRVGPPRLLQQRTGVLTPTDVSPDGEWMLLVNAPDRHQDVFLMRSNGRDLSRLTDDAARGWEPRFIGRGDSIVFRSNVSGTYDAWSIRRDGSNRTRLTNIPQGVFGAAFSPNGSQFAVSLFPDEGQDGGVMLGGPPWPMTLATGKAAAGVAIGTAQFRTYNWSRDGRWLSGNMDGGTSNVLGHAIYDLATGTVRQLNNDAISGELAFLPGYRDVVYFNTRGALLMQNIETLQQWVIADSLPYPPDRPRSIVASPDGRTLYYGAQQVESNIWVVRRAGTKEP
jgi:serine/threonine-protein kinase